MFLPAFPSQSSSSCSTHGLETKKAPARSIGEVQYTQSVQSHSSSPPILLSHPHNLPSTSQSRHVKGEYFASPTPTQQLQQFARIHMEISATPSRAHARTHATRLAVLHNPVLSTDPLRYLRLDALTPSAVQHAFLHAATKNNARCARLEGIDRTSDATAPRQPTKNKDDACA